MKKPKAKKPEVKLAWAKAVSRDGRSLKIVSGPMKRRKVVLGETWLNHLGLRKGEFLRVKIKGENGKGVKVEPRKLRSIVDDTILVGPCGYQGGSLEEAIEVRNEERELLDQSRLRTTMVGRNEEHKQEPEDTQEEEV